MSTYAFSAVLVILTPPPLLPTNSLLGRLAVSSLATPLTTKDIAVLISPPTGSLSLVMWYLMRPASRSLLLPTQLIFIFCLSLVPRLRPSGRIFLFQVLQRQLFCRRPWFHLSSHPVGPNCPHPQSLRDCCHVRPLEFRPRFPQSLQRHYKMEPPFATHICVAKSPYMRC